MKNVATKKGRPPNTVIDRLRVMAWFVAVREASGLPTAYQLEKHFSNTPFKTGPNGECIRPHQWERYERGDTVPNDKTVKKVSDEFPGTEKWLSLQLWEVIGEKRPCHDTLLLIIGTIRPAIAKRLAKVSTVEPDSQPKNSKRLTTAMTDSLWRQGDIAALTALLGIVVDAEYKGSDYQHADAAAAALAVFLLIASRQREPFYAIREPLFEYLCERFFTRDYGWDINLGAQYIDINEAVLSWKHAIEYAIHRGLIGQSIREQGRLAYWIWRCQLVDLGVSRIGYVWHKINDDECISAATPELERRLQNDDRRNPRRILNFLAIEKMRQLIGWPSHDE